MQKIRTLGGVLVVAGAVYGLSQAAVVAQGQMPTNVHEMKTASGAMMRRWCMNPAA